MHKWANNIMECVKTKIEEIGIENVEGDDLCEFEKWTKIAKNIAECDYYYNVVDAMENSTYEMTMEKYKQYSPENLRDMDRKNGIMYYTDMKHSDVEMKRHNYMDTRSMNALEEYLNAFADDMYDMYEDMDNSQRTMLRAKMQTMIQKI